MRNFFIRTSYHGAIFDAFKSIYLNSKGLTVFKKIGSTSNFLFFLIFKIKQCFCFDSISTILVATELPGYKKLTLVESLTITCGMHSCS